MKLPTIDDVLAFVPKGRSVCPREWLAGMTQAGFEKKRCQMIMQRLLDPEDLALVDLDSKMRFTLR